MANRVFSTAQNCEDCTWLRETHCKHKKVMKSFHAAGPSEFLTREQFVPLRKTARGSTFILVMDEQCFKMTRCILLWKPTAFTLCPRFWGTDFTRTAPHCLSSPKPRNSFLPSSLTLRGRVWALSTSSVQPTVCDQRAKQSSSARQFYNESDTIWRTRKWTRTFTCNRSQNFYNVQPNWIIKTTRFEQVLQRHCYSLTLSKTSDQPGTPALDKRSNPVTYRPTVIRRRQFAIENGGRVQTATRRR